MIYILLSPSRCFLLFFPRVTLLNMQPEVQKMDTEHETDFVFLQFLSAHYLAPPPSSLTIFSWPWISLSTVCRMNPAGIYIYWLRSCCDSFHVLDHLGFSFGPAHLCCIQRLRALFLLEEDGEATDGDAVPEDIFQPSNKGEKHAVMGPIHDVLINLQVCCWRGQISELLLLWNSLCTDQTVYTVQTCWREIRNSAEIVKCFQTDH